MLTEFSNSGQQQIFEEIVRRYAGLVFGVCLRTCRDAHDAEDATQAVFLALAVQCKSGNQIRHLPAWLRQVAKRTSLDVRKARKRREAREARRSAENNGIVNDGDDRPSAMDLQEIGHVLSEELAKLPAKYRLPLVSLYFGGLSREEIAGQLGLKPGALGVRIHRARMMLGERLKRRGAYPEGTVLAIGMAPMLDQAFGGALTLRTAEAAARFMLGHDLSGTVSSHVLSLMNGTAGAITIGRLKVVASVLLLLASVASGGSIVVAKSTDTVPQVVSQVRQWIGELRGLLTMPSLDLRADADSDPLLGRSMDDSYARETSVAPLEWPGSPLSPEWIGTQNALPPVAAVTPNVAEPSNTPVSNTLPSIAVNGKPTSGIEFPQVDFRPVAPSTPAVTARANETQDPTDTATAASGSAAAGGGAPVVLGSTPGAVATANGDVTISKKPTPSSRWVPSSNGKRPIIAGPTLAVGLRRDQVGSYTLDTGTLATGTEIIGGAGTGTFIQNGGTNTSTQVIIGDQVTGVGRYVQKGGTLSLHASASGAAAAIVVGGAGQGELILGDADTGGDVRLAPSGEAPLYAPAAGGSTNSWFIVRSSWTGSGTVRGWGRVDGGGGSFVNNDQVIADGYGKPRPLDLINFGDVTSTLENPTNQGLQGWYAHNGGSLTFSAMPGAMAGQFTWGEDVDDVTLDMVNSVRVDIQPPPEDLTVTLLAPDRSDIPALPRGHTFIGVWSLDASLVETESIDLTVRYDDAMAAELGLDEQVLKLWGYTGTEWVRINGDSFWRDPTHNLIGGTTGAIQFFAVSAPEPTGIVTVLLAGAGMLMRRRRRG